MGQGPGIQEQTVGPFARLVNGIDQGALVIGLHEAHRRIQGPGFGFDLLVDIRQGFASVDSRFTRPQQIEIGTIED